MVSVPPAPTLAVPGQAESFYGAVLEALPTAVVVARPTRDGDAEVVYANPAAARVANRARDELVGSRMAEWPPTGAFEAEQVPLGEILVATLRPFDDREAQLAEAQRIAHFGSWEWDMRTGTVTWSEELFRIYGVTPEQYTPSYEGYLGRVHPDDREHVAAAIARAAEELEPFSFEERILRPDGSVRVLESGGGVVVDDGGRPVKMVGACHDVTDRAHDQAELARRREAERQAKDINDSVISALVDAMQALDGGDLRGAQRAMHETLGHASRIVTELVGPPEQ